MKKSNKEKILVKEHAEMLCQLIGIEQNQAMEMSERIFDRVVEESKSEESYFFPENLGDIVLKKTNTSDPKIGKIVDSIRQSLPQKRRDGVKDKDILWWWNRSDIQRRFILADDNILLTYLAKSFLQSGLIGGKAIAKVRKYMPLYGEPIKTSFPQSDERPLPYELKDRVNKYMVERSLKDKLKYQEDMENAKSFNTLIRNEIREGNL